MFTFLSLLQKLLFGREGTRLLVKFKQAVCGLCSLKMLFVFEVLLAHMLSYGFWAAVSHSLGQRSKISLCVRGQPVRPPFVPSGPFKKSLTASNTGSDDTELSNPATVKDRKHFFPLPAGGHDSVNETHRSQNLTNVPPENGGDCFTYSTYVSL